MKTFLNEELKRIDFLDERFYQRDVDLFYPSVTHILDTTYPKGGQFKTWLKTNGFDSDKIMEKAGEEGSKIHDAIDRYLKGELISWEHLGVAQYNLTEWQCICKAIEFFETVKPVKIANEQQVFSDTYRYAGTVDYVCKINGETWLIDFKSSTAIYKTHELQLSAYAVALNEIFKTRYIDHVGILHLKAQTRGEDKKGNTIQGKGWKLETFDRDYESTFEVFKHTLAIFNEENPNPKPKNLEYPCEFQLQPEVPVKKTRKPKAKKTAKPKAKRTRKAKEAVCLVG